MSGWKRLVRQRVVVNLHSGRAFAGVLMSEKGGLLSLRNVMMFDADNPQGVAIDGTTVVELREVEFVQVP